MSDDEQNSPKKTNINATFTPGQLNLGLLVDNAGDDLFEVDGNVADVEEIQDTPRANAFHQPRTQSQPQINYKLVDNDDLESLHGDKGRVIMSDDDDDDKSFPRASSSDDDDNYSKTSRSTRYSSDEHESSNDTATKRHKKYMQIKNFCKRKKIDFPSHLHPESSYKDLKSYLSMLTSEHQMEQGVEACKKVIVGVTSVFEYLNTRFDPIGLKLTGYSEAVSDSRDDLTEPLEELYEEHADKFDVPPAVKIMMILGGAAAQTHVMNSMTGGPPARKAPEQTYHSSPAVSKQPSMSYSTKTVSDPAMDEDEDIQDILREMQQSDTRSNSSLTSVGTIARRKRGNKGVSLDDL